MKAVLGLVLCTVGFMAFGAGSHAGTKASTATFDEVLALAHAYDPWEPAAGVTKDPVQAAAHYRKAIDLRPNDARNLPLMVCVGELAVYGKTPPEGQRERLAVFDEVLRTFHPMDYYDDFAARHSGQQWYQMIAVATHAGEMQETPEKSRDYYLKGMRMLDGMYKRRIEEWRKAPAPAPPLFENDPRSTANWTSAVKKWERDRDRALKGNVFEDEPAAQMFVTALVKKYVETFGRLTADRAPSVLQPIIDEFPGTPLEAEARRVVALADDSTAKH